MRYIVLIAVLCLRTVLASGTCSNWPAQSCSIDGQCSITSAEGFCFSSFCGFSDVPACTDTSQCPIGYSCLANTCLRPSTPNCPEDCPSQTGTCEFPAVCGNGIVEAGEECDDGNDSNYDDCLNSCVAATCGDGWLNKLGAIPEECDDGNNAAGDGCTNCQLVEDCTQPCSNINPAGTECAIPLFGQTCLPSNPGPCSSTAGCSPVCGEIPNVIACAAVDCSGNYNVVCPPVCGNGILESGEECDDGNPLAGDGCDNCMLEPGSCSNWPAQSCELDTDCDFSTSCIDSTICVVGGTMNCQSNDECPNGYLCDDFFGCSVTTNLCLSSCPPTNGTCEFLAVCGNGIVDDGEECDDGNIFAGDGCDMMCQCEQPEILVDKTANVNEFSYSGEEIVYSYAVSAPFPVDSLVVTDDNCAPVVCVQTENVLNTQCSCTYTVQQSDLGQSIVNVANASGVNHLPECAHADTDTDQHTVDYEPVCGNGEKDIPGEQCDDGNVFGGDGCSGTCQCEPATGSILQWTSNKYCDEENLVAVEFRALIANTDFMEFGSTGFDCGSGNIFEGCNRIDSEEFSCQCKIKASYTGVVTAEWFNRLVDCRNTKYTTTLTPTIQQLECLDDGLLCNGQDMCHFDTDTCAAECVAGPPPDCSDNVTCTDDTCEEFSQQQCIEECFATENQCKADCENSPDTASCNAACELAYIICIDPCQDSLRCVNTPNDANCEAGEVCDAERDCEPDCNNNTIADSRDIEDGTSSDTNANGIPDECEQDGCTYTQGFWKNHPEDWPVLEDDEICGESFADILATPPTEGNAFYILAHQWIAAHLNLLSNTSMPDDVYNAYLLAEALLEQSCGMGDDFFAKKSDNRKHALQYAATLAGYNEGSTGPGHCDDADSNSTVVSSAPAPAPPVSTNNAEAQFTTQSSIRRLLNSEFDTTFPLVASTTPLIMSYALVVLVQ